MSWVCGRWTAADSAEVESKSVQPLTTHALLHWPLPIYTTPTPCCRRGAPRMHTHTHTYYAICPCERKPSPLKYSCAFVSLFFSLKWLCLYWCAVCWNSLVLFLNCSPIIFSFRVFYSLDAKSNKKKNLLKGLPLVSFSTFISQAAIYVLFSSWGLSPEVFLPDYLSWEVTPFCENPEMPRTSVIYHLICVAHFRTWLHLLMVKPLHWLFPDYLSHLNSAFCFVAIWSLMLK